MAGLSDADSVLLCDFGVCLGFFTLFIWHAFSCLIYRRRKTGTTEEIPLLSVLLKDRDQADSGLQGI